MNITKFVNFFKKTKSDMSAKLDVEEIDYMEDVRIRNASESLFERMSSDDQYDVAKKHALKRELLDE